MSESDHQKSLVAWFKLAYPRYADCIIASLNGAIIGGKNRYAHINHLKKMGMKNGVSDIQIAVPAGGYHGLWIELKDEGKTEKDVTEAQWKHIELMRSLGYEAIWCAGSGVAIAAAEVYMSMLE